MVSRPYRQRAKGKRGSERGELLFVSDPLVLFASASRRIYVPVQEFPL